MAIEPFFCALFDAQDKLIKKISWQDAKKGSSLIWDFFEKEKILEEKISFLGGVSGPGGFSNLRVAGTILNTLNLKFAIPLHQVRADIIILEMINHHNQENPQNQKPQNIVLNSFGKGVFLKAGENLIRKNIPDISSSELEKSYCISFLPESKQSFFKNGFAIPLQNFPETCLKVLKMQTSVQFFLPDYECAAVQ